MSSINDYKSRKPFGKVDFCVSFIVSESILMERCENENGTWEAKERSLLNYLFSLIKKIANFNYNWGIALVFDDVDSYLSHKVSSVIKL